VLLVTRVKPRLAKAAKLGLGVSKPWGEVSRYDMIVEAEGHLLCPAKLVVHGTKGTIRLYPSIPTSKYAPHKEAWHLLR
jgi:hypothetical protein